MSRIWRSREERMLAVVQGRFRGFFGRSARAKYRTEGLDAKLRRAQPAFTLNKREH